MSREVLDLIDKLLIKEPNNRPALIDVINHPWFCYVEEEDKSFSKQE